MPNASAPFKNKAPFHARILGLDYQAFGLDFINPPFPAASGCLSVTPDIDFNSSGPSGGPFSTESIIYTVSNYGATTINWTLTLSNIWLTADVLGGSLDPGQSTNVTVSLNAIALPVGNYAGTLSFVNATNACGDTTIPVNLTIANLIALSVYGRTKGGTATLIGFSEFTSPSTPPKKYLVETQVGDTGNWGHDCSYGYTDCTGYAPSTNVSGNHRIYSGAASYDPSTGVLTNGFVLNEAGRIVDVPSLAACLTLVPVASPLSPSSPTPYIPHELNYNTATTPTTLTYTFSVGNCVGLGSGSCPDGSAEKRSYTGLLTVTLSSEDTEAAAIARLVAASSYTSYSLASAQGDVRSRYQNRVSGFSVVYNFAQYQLTKTGLLPTHLYNGSCVIYRRAYGTSDPWTYVSTTTVSGTTDGSGNFVFGPVSLPMAQGYEYTVWSATLTP